MTIKSEDQALEILDEFFARSHPALLLGRGDDCAELAPCGPLVVSTDLFIEDVHFRRSYFSPEDIGHKALAVNLSDLASAGAVPLAFTLGLAFPQDFSSAELRGVFAGMSALARKYAVPLAGGDLSKSTHLELCITVMGGPAAAGRPFLRRDPTPGELIFIVSPGVHCGLGLARRGLELLEQAAPEALAEHPDPACALLRPEPLLAAGQSLAALGAHVALMDVSDGLARDLPRFVGKHGAALEFDPGILHPALPANALEYAFSGGDDYLLLGSASKDALAALPPVAGCSLHIIGHVTAEAGILFAGKPLSQYQACAFDHFGGDK